MYKARHNHFTGIIYCRYPIRNQAHSRFAIAKLLTELAVLWSCVTTAVRIMKANIQEEWPVTDTMYHVV